MNWLFLFSTRVIKNSCDQEAREQIKRRFDQPDAFTLREDGEISINFIISYLIKRVCGNIIITTKPKTSTTIVCIVQYKALKQLQE